MLISDFARLGQVSVRMLRHYDALGLLVPDHVEPASGYRSYSPEQLHLLNRLVALKDLGFTLDQVRSLLADPVVADELRGMLRLRRAELEEEARAVGTRLAAIGQHVGPMFEEVSATLRHGDGALATPIATYAEVDEGMEVAVGYAWGGPAPDATEAIDQADWVTELQQRVTR